MGRLPRRSECGVEVMSRESLSRLVSDHLSIRAWGRSSGRLDNRSTRWHECNENPHSVHERKKKEVFKKSSVFKKSRKKAEEEKRREEEKIKDEARLGQAKTLLCFFLSSLSLYSYSALAA